MSQFQLLYPNEIYHIYNHANGNEKLFRCKENYHFFLLKLEQYLLPVMDIFTYSLIPNHFHLMVRIKSEDVIRNLFEKTKNKKYDIQTINTSDFVMERISNCLNSYAKSYNRMYNRMGGLFMATKRSIAKLEDDLTSFVLYVHKNAAHHGLTKRIGEWDFDGFKTIISNQPTYLLREELFEWFGSKEEFISIHENLKIERK